MKKRVLQLITGLATAGMLATTGFVGMQAIRGVMPAETTETVEFAMAENKSALSEGSDSKSTGCNTFAEVIADAGKSASYVQKYSAGYSGNVLIIHESNEYRFYTVKKGEKVRHDGTLKTNDPVKYKDGIYYVHFKDGTSDAYETYVVSSDGKRLIHKEYAQLKSNSYYAYKNTSSTSNGSNYQQKYSDAKSVYERLKKAYNNADVIYYSTCHPTLDDNTVLPYYPPTVDLVDVIIP